MFCCGIFLSPVFQLWCSPLTNVQTVFVIVMENKGWDDIRGNVCKRCEQKATEIEYCLKLMPKPFDPKKKVQDPPAEDKARISYVCEKCGAKSDIETEIKHKDDCKPSALGSASLKKVCAKSGHMPHASEAK